MQFESLTFKLHGFYWIQCKIKIEDKIFFPMEFILKSLLFGWEKFVEIRVFFCVNLWERFELVETKKARIAASFLDVPRAGVEPARV